MQLLSLECAEQSIHLSAALSAHAVFSRARTPTIDEDVPSCEIAFEHAAVPISPHSAAHCSMSPPPLRLLPNRWRLRSAVRLSAWRWEAYRTRRTCAATGAPTWVRCRASWRRRCAGAASPTRYALTARARALWRQGGRERAPR
eukprot:4783095-Pleurochrysis_carterae.AAC.2